jgi:hypothetical protein
MNMNSSNISENIAKHYDLWKSVVLNLVHALIGVIPKSVCGITLNFDGETIQITVFFEDQPSDADVEGMRDVEADLISHHDYQSELILSVIPSSESLIDKVTNWGWIYLRRED